MIADQIESSHQAKTAAMPKMTAGPNIAESTTHAGLSRRTVGGR
jgi:hypothetical protein